MHLKWILCCLPFKIIQVTCHISVTVFDKSRVHLFPYIQPTKDDKIKSKVKISQNTF